MKISILGHGFIGKNLVKKCIENGYVISVLSRHPRPSDYSYEQIEWVEGDICNEADVARVVDGSNVAFHLISNTVPGDHVDVYTDLFENVTSFILFLEVCLRGGVQRVVFVSSSSVYGDQKIMPIPETALPNPISSHAIQKITLEYYCNLFARHKGLDCKIVRLSNPYGPGQDIFGRQGFISILMGNLIKGNVTNIRGDGSVVRDYVYIEDVVNFMVILANCDSDDILFNFGSGRGVSLSRVVGFVEQIIGRRVSCQYGEPRLDDIAESVLDIQKAKDILGFTPKITLQEGLTRYISFLEIH